MTSRKHSSGSTGFGWVRSLLTFRHRNPVARFVSTILAFAIATLLVVGTGAAYGVDPSPAPAPTDTTTTTTDATPSTPAPAPTADPAPTVDPAPAATTDATPTPSTTSATQTTTSAPTPKVTSKTTTTSLAPALPALVPACPAPNGTALYPGGFEIDGNTCVNTTGNLDWDTTGQHVVDGAKDNTAYTQGDAENTDAAGWHTGGSSQGKDDITDAYSYTKIVSGDVWTYFAVQRVSDNGTTTYDVELNHNQNSSDNPSRPDRSLGDLLLQFSVNGTGPLSFDKGYQWTAKADFNSANCFESGTTGFGWCPLTTVATPNFESAVSTDGLFAEGALNLSALASVNGHICTGVFGQMNIRTVASEQHTAALQDFVLPFDTSIASTCGSIVINKYADDGTTPAGGAHFTISPDPTPGSTSAGPVTLVDGGSGDADNTANGVITISPAQAGLYTVTETQAPTGYLMPPLAQRSQTIQLAAGAGQTATFNFTDPYQWLDLTVDKSALATYSASYLWSIDKQVADSVNGPWTDAAVGTDSQNIYTTTGSGTAYYRVTVTEGARNTSNYHVTGNVRVKNPNTGRPVTVNLSDAIGATTCTFSGGTTQSVPGDSAFHSYPYDCNFGSTPPALTGNNQATVTWSKSSYPQSQADVGAAGNYTKTPTAAYDFTAPAAETSSTNKTIHVTDTRHTFTPDPYEITWSSEGNQTVLAYSRSISVGTGTCVTQNNTAAITETGQSDIATAKVCNAADLAVTKNKTVSMTRTYLWQIHKTRTSAASINSGDSANYSVTVDRAAGAGYQDSGWSMTGTITVTNPNDWESVTMSSLVDHYSGDNDPTNSCSIEHSRVAGTSTWGPVDLSLEAGQVMEYQYSCTFTTQPTYDGTNTATATWDAATAHTAADSGSTDTTSQGTAAVTSSEWSLNSVPVNKVITVTDSAYTGGTGTGNHTLGTLDWDNAPHTYTYSITWTAPAGTCETKPNTATIVETGQTSSASVQVCNSVGLSVAKTAAGHFDRTYHWSLDKVVSADPASDTSGWTNADTWTGPAFSHTFGYLVTLTQEPWTDSHFTITGSITLTNHNTDQAIPAISSTITDAPDVGAAATCVVDGGPDNGASLVGYTTPAIASGDSLTIDYLCSVADLTPAQYTGGDNSVSATNASNSPATAPVTFTKAGEIDKSVTVYDDKVTLSTPDVLGTETYDESVPNRTYSYTYTLEHTTTATQCEDFTNHASVFANTEVLTVLTGLPLATADATATVCPQAGTWTVAKSVAEPATVAVGTTLHYTLTATKTGGVNPTNVDVVDDLTAIAPYITGAPVVTTAGADTSYSGTKLTWHIGELAGEQTLQFEVTLKGDAYSADLPNLVTSVGSQNCPDAQSATAACKTDNGTPAPPIVSPPIVSPPKQPHHPSVLPNTGGPDGLWLAGGLALVLAGGALVVGDRRRRRRS